MWVLTVQSIVSLWRTTFVTCHFYLGSAAALLTLFTKSWASLKGSMVVGFWGQWWVYWVVVVVLPWHRLVVVGAPVQLNSCLLTADQPAQTLLPCNRIKNKVNQSGKDGNILKGFEGPKVRAIFKYWPVISQNWYTGNSRAPAEVILRWGSKARQLGCCSRPAVLWKAAAPFTPTPSKEK